MEHWKLQRISAIIMIPVVILSLMYLVNITSIPYDQLIEDLSSISGFILSVVFIGFILFHSSMGLEVIIEDYIHSQTLQNNIISLSKLFHIISFFLTILILASI